MKYLAMSLNAMALNFLKSTLTTCSCGLALPTTPPSGLALSYVLPLWLWLRVSSGARLFPDLSCSLCVDRGGKTDVIKDTTSKKQMKASPNIGCIERLMHCLNPPILSPFLWCKTLTLALENMLSDVCHIYYTNVEAAQSWKVSMCLHFLYLFTWDQILFTADTKPASVGPVDHF